MAQQNRHGLSWLVALGTFAGCKETVHTPAEQEDFVRAQSSPSAEFYASDLATIQSTGNFYFRVFGESFSRRLADLPLSGEVPDDKKPYSGSYYPESRGGTGRVVDGTRSPLQKYDDAFYGGQSKSADWERKNHTKGAVDWAGHCNGFASAAQRHPKEPARSVKRGNVTFSPKDIKALLAEIYMSADYQFLGGNRCESPSVPSLESRQDDTVMGECEDINPGTLHATIANWLGRVHHTIIMELKPGQAIWNYPLYRYESKVLPISAADATSKVGRASSYKWNPNAVKFSYVTTRLTYADDFADETLGNLTPKTLDLTYVLELDGDGQIVGGEWAGEQSRNSHPDFLWVALEPAEPNGTEAMGNQFLDSRTVISMWAESLGFDPNNPPSDIKRPAGTDDWGRFNSLQVTLDGRSTGAVFAGKPAVLRVKRYGNLNGSGYVLDVALNDRPAGSVITSGNNDAVLTLNPGDGLNALELDWKKDGQAVEHQYIRFRVSR